MAILKVSGFKNKNKGNDFRIFLTTMEGECLACPMCSSCFPPGRKTKMFTMSVNKTDTHETIRAVAARMENEAGLKIFSCRMPLIERTFAEIKSTPGFKRFLQHGLKVASLEWTVRCLSFNFRRMYAIAQQGQEGFGEVTAAGFQLP